MAAFITGLVIGFLVGVFVTCSLYGAIIRKHFRENDITLKELTPDA